MKIFWTLEPASRRNLLILFAVGLLFWSSMASLLPTLPPYIQHIGGDDRQVGIVMGAFAIGLLLFRPWLGKTADRKSRKLVLLLGSSIAAIAPFGFLFFKSIPLLILIRAFHGIGVAAFTTGYSALVVDLSPIRVRGELIGYMSLVTPIGIAVGPAIGGLLEAWGGYAPLFILGAVLGILSLIGGSQIEEKKAESLEVEKISENPVKTDRPFWELIFSPPLRIPSIIMLLMGLALGSLITFIPLFIAQTKVDLNAGVFYTVAALASFASRLFTGRASDRYGRGVFITVSLVSYGLAMLILSQAYSAIAFIIGAALEGFGAGTIIPMIVALLSDRSSPQERGRVFSLCVSGLDLGIGIAGYIFGSLTTQLGYRGIFALSSVLCLFGLIIFITQSSKNINHSWQFALGRGKDDYALDK